MQHPQPIARILFDLTEPISLVNFFAEEPDEAMAELGFRNYWDGYFAGRAAPLGRVPAEVVHAAFTASPRVRSPATPMVWDTTTPEAAHAARERGCVAALRRILGDLVETPALARAADILATASTSAPTEGRVMYAGLRTLPMPGEPAGCGKPGRSRTLSARCPSAAARHRPGGSATPSRRSPTLSMTSSRAKNASSSRVASSFRTREIALQPVIDLNQSHAVNGYEHPALVKHRTLLRMLGDAFPHSTNIGYRRLDHDHPRPYVPPDRGGPPGESGDHSDAPLTSKRAATGSCRRPSSCSRNARRRQPRWSTPRRRG